LAIPFIEIELLIEKGDGADAERISQKLITPGDVTVKEGLVWLKKLRVAVWVFW
jgi:hypothetical protein